MHYIRFLRPPTLTRSRSQQYIVEAKIAITNDLREDYLVVDTELEVYLNSGIREQKRTYQWKAGARALEISIAAGQDFKFPFQLVVRPKDASLNHNTLAKVIRLASTDDAEDDDGGLLPLWSLPLNIGDDLTRRSFRNFYLGEKKLVLCEDLDSDYHSHVWDSSVVLSSYLYGLATPQLKPIIQSLPTLPFLQEVLNKSHFRVLELGTGNGMVGVTMASCFPQATFTITDLSAARELAEINIESLSSSNISYQSLDWEDALPDEPCTEDLDLVVMADCTYNTDVFPALIRTLRGVLEKNKNSFILCATKVRNESELEFVSSMIADGFQSEGEVKLRLPHRGLEDQHVIVTTYHL